MTYQVAMTVHLTSLAPKRSVGRPKGSTKALRASRLGRTNVTPGPDQARLDFEKKSNPTDSYTALSSSDPASSVETVMRNKPVPSNAQE